jgi:hypothetical protein
MSGREVFWLIAAALVVPVVALLTYFDLTRNGDGFLYLLAAISCFVPIFLRRIRLLPLSILTFLFLAWSVWWSFMWAIFLYE